jgi:hypothetical protein
MGTSYRLAGTGKQFSKCFVSYRIYRPSSANRGRAMPCYEPFQRPKVLLFTLTLLGLFTQKVSKQHTTLKT